MEFYEYITKDGDRWDLIAYEFYADATLYEPIIKANPDISIAPTLPAGINLQIPILEDKEEIEFILPPWRN
ncbi:MAG: tail protein X [bacterium]